MPGSDKARRVARQGPAPGRGAAVNAPAGLPDPVGSDPAALLPALVDALPVAVACCDAEARCRYVSRAFAQLVDREGADLLGLPLAALFAGAGDRGIEPELEEARRGLGPVVFERGWPTAGDDKRWVEGRILPQRDVPDARLAPTAFFVHLTDITRRRLAEVAVGASQDRLLEDRAAAEARLRRLSRQDALTGLANRASFMEGLDDAIAAAQSSGALLALLSIDLDHFKRVNDSLGHVAGDLLLRTVAERVTACLGPDDLVARFGGDEFIVLATGLPAGAAQTARIEGLARAILASISAPLDADGRMISVTPSIGVALYPGDGKTPGELFKNADAAMYQAKSRGRANLQFFDRHLASPALAALVLESQLAEALDRGEFELHFQPQVGAADGRVRGAEALIRWRHPYRGLLGADAFILLAEEHQMMLPIGQWVLREAARCAVRWRAMGLSVGPVAVNLSNIQFQSIGFVEAVASVLPAAGIEPADGAGLIELELTERMLMDDLEQVKPRLAHLKAMGLAISIDDFGTGYSSLAHLTELPIDKLKVDRSFLRDLPGNQKAAAIIGAIVQMGHSLGMTVNCEGVEAESQRAFLAGIGCDELQGMLFGAPMPQAAFEGWLAANAAAKR